MDAQRQKGFGLVWKRCS